MHIAFACPKCARRLSIATRKAGAVVPCPACNQRIIVPLPSEDRLPGVLREPTPEPTALSSEPVMAPVTEYVYQPGLPPPGEPEPTFDPFPSDPEHRIAADYEPIRRRRKKGVKPAILICMGVLALVTLIVLVVGYKRIVLKENDAPDSVRHFITAYYTNRMGERARIVRVEYLPIKGKMTPTNWDRLQDIARNTQMLDPQWPAEKGNSGNNGPSHWDKDIADKIIKEQGLGATKPAPPPAPDLRVDGAYLVEFREPVWAGRPFDEHFHSRMVFIMRPGGGSLGNPFDVIIPGDYGTDDWRAVVRGLVMEGR